MTSPFSLNKIATVVIPLLFFIWNGFAGIDFGMHWDEANSIQAAQSSIVNQVWLPPFYNYPSLTYWLTVASALPEIIVSIGTQDRSAYVETHLSAHEHTLRTRHLFVLVTASTIVMVYLALLILHDNHWVALAAAFMFALSWEVGYHTRWIAPDGLVMAAGSLTLLMALLTVKNPQQRLWLWLAAVAAGLTLASKYNGGLVGLYVMIAAHVQWRNANRPVRELYIMLFQAGLICVLTFAVITPGVLLDTKQFVADVRFEFHHYRDFGHVNNTVDPYLPHAWLNLQYLAAVMFSPFVPLALILAAFIPFGVYHVWRQSRAVAALILVFPVVYFVFMSTQRVMIVRNLLVLIPPMTILAASGVYFVWQRMKTKRIVPFRWALILLIISVFIVNANWLISATNSIRSRLEVDRFARQAGRFITDHPDTMFCLSAGMMQWFNEIEYSIPANITTYPQEFDYAMYLSSEVERTAVPQNRPILYRWFGPHEVNYNYYSNWEGDSRIVVVDADLLAEAQLPIESCVSPAQTEL